MKFANLSLIVFSVAISNIYCLGNDDKCRVLVMRGGGTKGAYETGALKAIVENLKPIEYQYDVVSGVSIGAVNSVMLAVHPKGKEHDAVVELENIWRTH